MNNPTETVLHAPARNFVIREVLKGGICAGVADFLYASITTMMAGHSWTQPWLGVAGGLIGRAAKQGGLEIASIGVELHFFICTSAAALLYLIANRARWIPKQWIVLGILYGVAFLAVMNYVILPLSAIGRGIYPLEKIHIAAFFHILLVGWPTAFFVCRALNRETSKN